MTKTLVATFKTHYDAKSAAESIKAQGLRTDDISIITKQEENGSGSTSGFEMSGSGYGVNNSRVVESSNDNISDGAVTGGVLGGLAGLLIGAGSMVVPGLGIIAAAGPIAGLLSGAVTGGIVGGLVDLGIPEERGREYEKEVKQGKVLFSMKTDEKNISAVTGILKNNNALEVNSF